LNIIPILYGDVILDHNNSFSIISGDKIILEICKKLQNYKVSKVIFCIEEDGLMKQGKNSPELIEDISISDLNILNLAKFDKKIDVTGGIVGKLVEIENICKLGIPVQILNGLKQGLILNALKNEAVTSTIIN
jgi:isopentenyl phosphate kinase